MSKPEYSFIRNETFSVWHRKLSDHYYLQDIDHHMWQLYDKQCQTIALLEEKSSNIKTIDLNSFQFQALRNLARDIPVFVLITHYNQEKNYNSFYLIAASKSAKQLLLNTIQKDRTYLTESSYMEFEAYMRKEKVDFSRIDKASILLDRFPLPKVVDYVDSTRDS